MLFFLLLFVFLPLSAVSSFPSPFLSYLFLHLPFLLPSVLFYITLLLSFRFFVFVLFFSPLPSVSLRGSSILPSVFLRGSGWFSFCCSFSACTSHPPSSAVSASAFALLRPSFCVCVTLLVSLCPSAPFFLRIHLLRFLSVWVSLSLSLSLPLPLGSLSGIGIVATGLPLRLGSQSFVVFFHLPCFRFL